MDKTIFPHWKEGNDLQKLSDARPTWVESRIELARRDITLMKNPKLVYLSWCYGDPEAITIAYDEYAEGAYIARKCREYRAIEYLLRKPMQSKQPEGWASLKVDKEMFLRKD